MSKTPPKILRIVNDAWASAVQSGFSSMSNMAPANWAYSKVPLLEAEKLDGLFDGNWLAKRIVALKPEIALKDGMGWSEEVQAAYELVGVRPDMPEGVVMRAAVLSRLHGGAVMLAAHESGAGNMTLPLSESPGAVVWLDVIPKSWLKIMTREGAHDSVNPDAPAILEVTKGPREKLQFHVSRCLTFMGDAPSPSMFVDELDAFWGAPVLQAVYEAILRLGQRHVSVDRLVSQASISALELEGLLEALAGDETGVMSSRLAVLQEGIERTHMVLLEKGETFVKQNVAFGGLDIPITQARDEVAGASGYPVTKLFGTSPGGLNATGESDQTNFYNELETWRERIKPQLVKLAGWLSGEAQEIEFEPLLTPTKAERTNEFKAHVEALNVVEGWGAATAESLTQSLVDDGYLSKDVEIVDDGDETETPGAANALPTGAPAQAKPGLPAAPELGAGGPSPGDDTVE